MGYNQKNVDAKKLQKIDFFIVEKCISKKWYNENNPEHSEGENSTEYWD